MLVLVELFDSLGRTDTSNRHRLEIGDRTFYKHLKLLQYPGNLNLRIKAWASVPACSAILGSAGWHLTSTNLQRIRRWELQKVRQMLRLKRCPDDSNATFNQRTAKSIYSWFANAKTMLVHHRVLKQVYVAAWRERTITVDCGAVHYAGPGNLKARYGGRCFVACHATRDDKVDRSTGGKDTWQRGRTLSV